MIWLVLAALAAFLLFILFVLYVSYRLVKPPRYVGEWTPSDLGLEYEEVALSTEDGVRLEGWWMDRGSAKTVVLLHGYTVSRWAFYIRKMIEFLAQEDYNILAFDFRAHGRSGGRYTTFGNRELLDLKAALEWLRANKPDRAVKIGLIGYSMGGIVTIRALAEGVADAGVADSPPFYADKSAARGLKYFAKLPSSLYPLVRVFAQMLIGVGNVDVMGYAKKVRRPLLIIVGRQDPLVKVEEAEEFLSLNRRVNPNVELWVGEGAHVRIIEVEPDEYRERVLDFLRAHL